MKNLILPFLFIGLSAVGQVEFNFESSKALPSVVNSEFEETAPFFDPIKKALYFTRTLHPENNGGNTAGQDIWVSYQEEKNWTKPANDFLTLNNQLNNSVVGVSADGNTLYLISTYQKKISLLPGFSASQYDGSDWSKPEKLPSKGITIRGNFYSGIVNASGSILIISMEGNEALGQEDLYISFLENGNWTEPIWMGDSLNSEGFEISPFLFDDNRTLMFASSGHGGYGDCDIFYAYRTDSSWNHWTKPINMGKVINSEKFDAFAFPVDDLLYFSSNRDGERSDLYSAVNESYFKTIKPIHFTFRMNNSSLNGVTVNVLDEDGLSIGKFQSDDNDVVTISDLKQSKSYSFVALNSMVDIGMFTPFQLNDDGQPIAQHFFMEDGSFSLVAEESSKTDSRPGIAYPTIQRGMSGVFELDRVPVRNTFLALKDENGKGVQYAKTDDEGTFHFAEMEGDKSLHMDVLSELEYVKEHGVVYYTDANGRKLFKAAKGENGSYTYQKLEAQELDQLKLLQDLDKKGMSATQGVFKYKDLPKQGVELHLLDENDNIVETVTTDANGQFRFSKLRPDHGFSIRAADATDTDLNTNGLILFKDKEGNELNILNNDQMANGFYFTPLSSELTTGLKKLAEEDRSSLRQNYVFSVGLFKYQNLPKQYTTLRLLDDKDNLIETVTTDGNGRFIFSKLTPNLKYKVQVIGMEDSKIDQSALYFVSWDGKVTTAKLDQTNDFYTFSHLDPGYFFSINQVNENENNLKITESFKDVSGLYKYNSLPKSGVQLYLLDENDKIIETVYTDENGNFRFSKLAKESNYYVKLSEQDASLLDASTFVLQNENNEELEQEELQDDGFRFKTLPRVAQSISALEEGDEGNMDASKFMRSQGGGGSSPTGGITDLLGGGKNDLKLNVTHFHFNSVRLSDRDRAHLNHEVVGKAKRSGQPVLVIGYSCDLGSPEEQQAIARRRSLEIKSYLISTGIPESQIVTTEVIGSLKGFEKPCTDQRVEARKVEVFHLVP